MVSARGIQNYAVQSLTIRHLAVEAITDPALFPKRDNLIRHLVSVCGWPRSHAAELFNLSPRQVRRITTPEKLRLNLIQPASTSTLSKAEIESMARDYADGPYAKPEDRDAAWAYLEEGCPLVAG